VGGIIHFFLLLISLISLIPQGQLCNLGKSHLIRSCILASS
jgi:hypothetical protein